MLLMFLKMILLFVILVSGFIILSTVSADMVPKENLTIYTLNTADIPGGYQIVDNGSNLSINGSCNSDLCLKDGYEVAYYNDSVYLTQIIMKYSQPVSKKNLYKIFNETYPQVSKWVTGEFNSSELGNNSIAFTYTVPPEMNPIGVMKGYIIVSGNGDLYQTFETINGQLSDLENFALKAIHKN